MQLRSRILVALTCTLLCGAPAQAAGSSQPLILEHLSTQQGLPQGTVMATLQDSQGFIWLGTEDGLVRFDGNEVRVYAARRNEAGSLSGNFINDIREDARGNLWVAIKGGGLARWDRATDRFTVFRHDPDDAGSLGSDQVRCLLLDRHGRLWVGFGTSGVDVLDTLAAGPARFKHYRHDAAQEGSLSADEVFVLFQDRNDTIWVGTRAGLDRWQPGGDDFAHIRFGANVAAQGHAGVSAITQDRGGALWVGTFQAGLYKLDDSAHVLRSYLHDPRNPDSLADNEVRAVLEDHAGHLWVGTANGLELLRHAATGEFAHYRHDASDATSLLDSFVMSLYEDAGGMLWIGTRSGGVSRWSPRSWELGGYRPAWLQNRMVTSFAQAGGNALWVGSMGGGLVRLDTTTGEWSDIDRITGRRNALGDNRVMSLLRDRSGALWIGTMSGLRRLGRDGSLVSLPTRAGDPHALSHAGIMSLYESHSGQIWVGTHGGGVNIIDASTMEVRQLPPGSADAGRLSHGIVTAIIEDRHGRIWLGTDGGGLNLARADGKVIRVFRHDARDPRSLAADSIYGLSIDPKGRLWVATDGGGLDQVVGDSSQPAEIHFTNWSIRDGLSGDTVYAAVPDAEGRLWLSGNSGLTRLDPDTREVKVWHREQGLQGDEFNYGAWLRTSDGRLCFGGPGGFNVFDPARLTEGSTPPRVALTNLTIQGVPAGAELLNDRSNPVTLRHDAAVVALRFAALDFTSPARNRLQYRLDTLGERWWDIGAAGSVQLNNLASGTHHLEVRAANADGAWSLAPYRLSIYKRPPPWLSWWAWCSYVLLIASIIALAIHAQRRKLRFATDMQHKLEAEVAQRTEELRTSNRQLAEASQAKSDFLARMGHELRTPMNGVVGMTELLTRTELTEGQRRLTGTIQSSAKTLLQILNDLLDLSKINAGKIQLESLPVNPTQLMEEVATLFAASAEAKKLELVVCPPVEQAWMVRGDSLRLRQVLMNLVGNAVKFTAQGEIVMRCHLEQTAAGTARVRFTVSDTGIGMTMEVMARIFQPFTQADETTTRRFGGTGLGLTICRELVEMMGGSIRVDSRPDVGSTFVVDLSLPVHEEPQSLPSAESALRDRPVRIITHRPALAEALDIYLRSAGLRPSDDVLATDTLFVVDADGCVPEFLALQARTDVAAGALIAVASAEAVNHLALEKAMRAERVLRKPIGQDALRAALASLAGEGEASSARPDRRLPSLNAHVLVVDDEAVNAAVAEGYLGALGCTSVWVDNGRAAIERCATERFDAVLMDINMSGIDGYETTQRIREREVAGRRVAIIALTANEVATHRERCLLAGMDEILPKPYSIEDCADVLQRLIPQAVRAVGQPHGHDAALATVDESALARLRVGPGPGKLYGRLVGLFASSSGETLEAMRAALAADDLATCAALAHKLRGSAANVGATAFSQGCRDLEQACRSASATRSAEWFGRLMSAHPPLLAALEALRVRESA